MSIFPQQTAQKYDLILFFKENQTRIQDILMNNFNRFGKSMKWYFNVQVKMVKFFPDGDFDEAHPHFRC